MVPSNVQTQRIPTVDCASCAMPMTPNTVPENGVCPGCGGAFYKTPRIASTLPPQTVRIPALAPRPQVAKAVTKSGGKGMLIGGIAAAVCVITAVVVSLSGKKTPEPASAPQVAPVVAPVPIAPVVQRFTPLEFGSAATADTRVGMFRSLTAPERLEPRVYGRVEVAGVPFVFADPAASPRGKNVIALRGGFEYARTAYPQSLEIPLNGIAIRKLHILSPGGGWAWPWNAARTPNPPKGEKALKFTVVRENGATESREMLNGIDVADHVYKGDLPGAKTVPGLLKTEALVRYVTYDFPGGGKASKLVIEGFDNHIVAIVMAMTVEVAP